MITNNQYVYYSCSTTGSKLILGGIDSSLFVSGDFQFARVNSGKNDAHWQFPVESYVKNF